MNILDRLLLGNFLKAWVVCFCSLVSLYVVIDLFNKLDGFIEAARATAEPLTQVIATYYAFQLVLIFDQLCGVILLLAGMFTVTWMQRNNEVMPLLAAGVPMRRVLRPVFGGALGLLAVAAVNREVVMPRVADHLRYAANDPQGQAVRPVTGAYEPNGILIAGQGAVPKERLVLDFTCVVPDQVAGTICHIAAKEARYIPPGKSELSGGWLLTRTTPTELPPWKEPVFTVLDAGKFFLRTEQVDFDILTRSRSWYQFASTADLYGEMHRAGAPHLSLLAVQLHTRLTTPLVTLLLVGMGIALVLRDQCRNIYWNAGLCLALAAVFYVCCYAAKHLGEQEYLSPALAAWLPLLIFGPFAVVWFDAVHT
jgi:lipopolysaccharide export system permease protein